MGTLRGPRPCPNLKPKAESSPPNKKNSQLEKNNASRWPPQGARRVRDINVDDHAACPRSAQ